MSVKRAIETRGAPRPAGAYSQAVAVGSLVFAAGQGGFDPVTREPVSPGVEAQTEQALRNLDAVLAAHGGSLADVVKVSVFLADVRERELMNRVFARVMPNPRPARTTVQAVLPEGLRVEIDAIATVATCPGGSGSVS